MLELLSGRSLSVTEAPSVPCFFAGDERFALNRNIFRPSYGSNLSVKKCITVAYAEHEDMWKVLLEF